jgi:hypothetical protein
LRAGSARGDRTRGFRPVFSLFPAFLLALDCLAPPLARATDREQIQYFVALVEDG